MADDNSNSTFIDENMWSLGRYYLILHYVYFVNETQYRICNILLDVSFKTLTVELFWENIELISYFVWFYTTYLSLVLYDLNEVRRIRIPHVLYHGAIDMTGFRISSTMISISFVEYQNALRRENVAFPLHHFNLVKINEYR